jgi:hypothetical protein
MEHGPLDQIRREASIVAFGLERVRSLRALRRQRLQRFATVLKQHGGAVKLFSRIEFLPDIQRSHLSSEDSPLAIPFADPVLYDQGLKGDHLGDAVNFFLLSATEVHYLSCDCDSADATTSERIRTIAHKKSTSEILTEFDAVLRSWTGILAGKLARLLRPDWKSGRDMHNRDVHDLLRRILEAAIASYLHLTATIKCSSGYASEAG